MPRAPVRLEIQGLRAIAVLAVLVFHIWPSALPGGYVGVDVFFVISGFLITGVLLREAERTGGISLAGFYQRRIRRLLPAATLVVIVASLCFPLLPQAQWPDLARDAIASTLYLQNWWLAAQSVDYLAEGNAPGLLQHYWSLSVEEQYYIVWPFIAWFMLAWSATARAHPARSLWWTTVVLGILSFCYSIHLVRHDPPPAYFATTTRAWELAIGGILATSGPVLARVGMYGRVLAGWSGLAMIAAAACLYGPTTPFPGYAALLPTVGAALVILAGQTPQAWSSFRLLKLRPLQFVGDISYSLYLWHWPLLIAYQAVMSHAPMPWWHGIVIMVTALALAWLTKTWVEDPFRHGPAGWRAGRPSCLAIMAVSASLVLAISGAIALLDRRGLAESVPITPALLNQLYDASRPTVPAAKSARSDNPDVYQLKCHVNQTSDEPKSCTFGPPAAPRVAALIGDSHAAQWIPALQQIYQHRPEWRLVTFTKSACAFNAQDVTIGSDRRPYESCSGWNLRVLDEIRRLSPEVIVVSASAGYRVLGIDDPQENLRALANGLLTRWRQLRDTGARVVAIRDTPHMGMNVAECMSSPKATVAGCSTPVESAMRPDPIVEAMRSHPDVTYLDLSREICDDAVCSPVRGQVLTYRDRHHLTATFARLLADKISPALP